MKVTNSSLSLTDKQHLCETTKVTLNGNPARITGANLKFAQVYDLTTRMACEFAWPTVARIVARGGRFAS